jgi:CAAD domains of cyanobacterial aminoacyl-tRNA synthetase
MFGKAEAQFKDRKISSIWFYPRLESPPTPFTSYLSLFQGVTMEPEVKKDDMTVENVTVKIDSPGPMATFSTDSSNEQLNDISSKVSEFLADLPSYLSDFFGEYKRPIVNIGLIIAALIALKLLLAVLGAINDLPIFSSMFELIGMGYSAWFIWRYLLKASTREQLGSDFTALKEQILGNK